MYIVRRTTIINAKRATTAN